MKGPLLALRFLTRLPLPDVPATENDFARAMRWFPLAGLAVGLGVLAATGLGAKVDPWLGALAGLAAWIGMTGALHLDGLGDVADAAGAAHGDRTRLSAVLADPHIGSFGVVVIVLQCLAKLVLLHLLVAGSWAVIAPSLLLVPMMARCAPLGWSLTLPPLHQGLGTLFASAIRRRDLVLWSAALLGLALVITPALLVAPLAALSWGWWVRTRIGGISGDGHGAGIELLETALLLALVLAR